MAVGEKEVRHVAQLARLEVDDGEVAALVEHFNTILGYFERLKEVDTSSVADVLDNAEVTPWRDDEVRIWENRDEALAQAPDRDGDYFRVPQILEEA
jgi:aspartyl-tRNA(Asn)/glutamyl-tRNA(Gln) amidotransferase subunit C